MSACLPAGRANTVLPWNCIPDRDACLKKYIHLHLHIHIHVTSRTTLRFAFVRLPPPPIGSLSVSPIRNHPPTHQPSPAPSPAPFCFFPVTHPVSYTSAGTDQPPWKIKPRGVPAQRLGNQLWARRRRRSECCSTGIYMTGVGPPTYVCMYSSPKIAHIDR
jgi:hypothetical protein